MDLERASLLIGFLSELRRLNEDGTDTGDKIPKVADELVSILIPHKELCSMCGSEDVELTSLIDSNNMCITKTCFTCGVTENKVPPTSRKNNYA